MGCFASPVAARSIRAQTPRRAPRLPARLAARAVRTRGVLGLRCATVHSARAETSGREPRAVRLVNFISGIMRIRGGHQLGAHSILAEAPFRTAADAAVTSPWGGLCCSDCLTMDFRASLLLSGVGAAHIMITPDNRAKLLAFRLAQVALAAAPEVATGGGSRIELNRERGWASS